MSHKHHPKSREVDCERREIVKCFVVTFAQGSENPTFTNSFKSDLSNKSTIMEHLKILLRNRKIWILSFNQQDQFKFYMESFGNVEEKWYHGRHRVISCWSWWQLLWVGGTCNRAHCFRQIPRKRRQWWCSSRLQMQGRFFRTELRHHGTISGNFRIILNSGVTPPSANPLDNSSSHFFFQNLSRSPLFFQEKRERHEYCKNNCQDDDYRIYAK